MLRRRYIGNLPLIVTAIVIAGLMALVLLVLSSSTPAGGVPYFGPPTPTPTTGPPTPTPLPDDPPVASCIESVNPSGKKVPPAGSTTLPGPKGGQNEDGYYELIGEDNEDGTAPVFVTNASGSVTFGRCRNWQSAPPN